MCSDTFHAAAALLSSYVKQMECAGKRKKKKEQNIQSFVPMELIPDSY